MKMRIVRVLIVLIMVLSSNLQAKQEIVLSITGADISGVVDQFNVSQPDFHVVIEKQKYRNWGKQVIPGLYLTLS